VATVALARVAGEGSFAWLQTFAIVFGSLVISALPFVAIGAVAAAAISVFVPITAIARIGRLPRPLQLPVAGLAGMAFPICECGSVPIARRMMLRGLAPGPALTFMLASPIVNPVVLVSTFVAYQARGPVLAMVGGRFVLGLLTAIAAGWVLGGRGADLILRPRDDEGPEPVHVEAPEARWRTFFVHLSDDFAFMARYLLIGAAVAGLVQTFLPQGLIAGLASVPILDAVALMAFAAILSLCSESDAFIAASLGGFGFGPSSQLAFLVFGPMVDLKLMAIYSGAFRRTTVRAIVVTAAAATLVGALWLRVVIG
jgi:uncharacterized membrane protein YraQ (UPF0718 family)